jgi:[ribosomal protein S5]-alanine N-acetyltransferase
MRIEFDGRLSDGEVTLRRLRPGDASAYGAAYREDPDLGRLLGEEVDPDEAEVRERIDRQDERAAAGRSIELAIVDPGTDALWGSLILHSFDWRSRRAEIGFWLIPAARGRGKATAAVSLALSWAFAQLDLLRMEMTTTRDNPAVPALARRLGFTQEGVMRQRNLERGRRLDIVWFGLLREEWLARRAGV